MDDRLYERKAVIMLRLDTSLYTVQYTLNIGSRKLYLRFSIIHDAFSSGQFPFYKYFSTVPFYLKNLIIII